MAPPGLSGPEDPCQWPEAASQIIAEPVRGVGLMRVGVHIQAPRSGAGRFVRSPTPAPLPAYSCQK